MGQRSVISNLLARLGVEDLADHVEDLALGDVADGNRDGLTGVAHLLTANHAVGRLEGDRADQVVTEVLCDLESDLDRLVAERDRGLQGVVDVRDRVVRELDVDDRARDACDAPDDRGPSLGCGGGGHIFVSFLMVYLLDERASAPPTISAICCVISA